ncbi:MAG: winged helix-turn-helix transcriptional regulator [Eubacteriales bacterium]|nr:winged helix-turn-helix transcriptional regulator [Eubacteriales bacterium]
MLNVEESVFNVLESAPDPLNLFEISQKLGISLSTTNHCIQNLLQNKKITEVGSKTDDSNRKRRYYTVLKSVQTSLGDLEQMSLSIANTKVGSKELYIELKEKVEVVEENVNKLYINIIAILGVFVAIFSLITVNTSVLVNATILSNVDLLRKIGIVNGSLVITIAALFLLIKYLIIIPQKRK